MAKPNMLRTCKSDGMSVHGELLFKDSVLWLDGCLLLGCHLLADDSQTDVRMTEHMQMMRCPTGQLGQS